MRVWKFWVWGWVGGGAGWGGVGWDVNVHCDCNHTVRSLALHTYVLLRCCTFPCTSTHTSCYAAGRSLALPHIRHATLLHVLLHFHTYVMLRARTACYADGCEAWKRASKQQVPEKRLKWQNFARNSGEFVKHLGGSPRKRVLLWPEHRL